MKKESIHTFGIFIWVLAILFFFYEFFLRIFLGTIAKDVMNSLGLSVEQFALVGAAYYITYALMQTPVGILSDRFGPRKVLTFACFVCAFGVFWLSVATEFYSAMISRLFIGFGSSFGFVCLLILALNWFPHKHFALLCGLAQFLGAIGPIMAGGPLAILNQRLDGNWRLILYWVGLLGVILTVLLFLFVRDKPKGKKNEIIFLTPKVPLRKRLTELCKNAQVWAILLYSACVYVSMPLLSAYWGTSYLSSKGYTISKAAFTISMIWVGFSFGAIFIGKLSDMMKRRKVLLALFGFFGVIFSSIILYVPIENELGNICVFLGLGMCSSGQSLAFPTISEHVPEKLHAPALGLNNMAIVGFGAIIPPFASSIIQSMAKAAGGETQIPTAAFTAGLSIMPVMFLLSFLIALFGIKETFCRRQHEVHKVRLS